MDADNELADFAAASAKAVALTAANARVDATSLCWLEADVLFLCLLMIVFKYLTLLLAFFSFIGEDEDDVGGDTWLLFMSLFKIFMILGFFSFKRLLFMIICKRSSTLASDFDTGRLKLTVFGLVAVVAFDILLIDCCCFCCFKSTHE